MKKMMNRVDPVFSRDSPTIAMRADYDFCFPTLFLSCLVENRTCESRTRNCRKWRVLLQDYKLRRYGLDY